MLNGSNILQLSWDSGESVNDLSLLDDFPFSYDSGVSVATTLVEGVLLEFPITQDLLDSQATSTMDTTSRPGGSKSDTCYPQTVSDSVLDGPQRSNSKGLSDSVDAITTTEAAPRFKSIWEKRKELWERRFTHPQKMKSSYASGGRY
jgi:hypothetical protein